MSVRSTDLKDDKPSRPRGTAIIKRSHAAAILRFLARILALVLLYGSWLGTSLLVAGAAPNPWWQLWQLPTSAIAVGFAVQAPITLAEFANRHRRSSWGYRVPFLVDLTTTYLGYRNIAVPWLLAALANDGSLPSLLGSTGIMVLANVVALGLSAAMAAFPELVLVDD